MRGKEGHFFLAKHHSGAFYTPLGGTFTAKDHTSYEDEVKKTKRYLKLLEKPKESLRAKDPADRFTAAVLLLARYRNVPDVSNKKEPIDAEQSKLILRAIAEADWGRDSRKPVHPMTVYRWLDEVKEREVPPPGIRSLEEYYGSIRDWLRKNQDTYRIQRYVRESK